VFKKYELNVDKTVQERYIKIKKEGGEGLVLAVFDQSSVFIS